MNLLSFLHKSKIPVKKHIYTTKNGIQCPMWYREGTSDWNTLMAGLEEDEYHLHQYDLKANDVAIDIGSHIGAISVLLATLGLKVYSVEGLPANAKLQKKNIALNKVDSQVVVEHKIIAGQGGQKKKLYYGDRSQEVGRHHEFIGTSAEFEHFFKKGRSAEVSTISINDLFAKYQISRCALLKIDVEGAEWEAVGAVSEDVWDRIDIFLGEWHSFEGFKSREQMLDLTRGKFDDISDQYNAPPNDFIFRRKALIAEAL